MQTVSTLPLRSPLRAIVTGLAGLAVLGAGLALPQGAWAHNHGGAATAPAATALAPAAAPAGRLVAGTETLLALTVDHQLVRFRGDQPGRILESLPLKGLKAGEVVLGMDFRVSRNQLYALASSGQLYRVKLADGSLEAVGEPVPLPATNGGDWGFDVNPAADRLRVVHESGINLRRHPDTGAQVDSDPAREGVQPDPDLTYDAADANAGKKPQVAAAGYTYNKNDEKITTNYAIDRGLGLLVTQGTREGVTPAVSPNTGRLFTVGALGLPAMQRVHFDISDVHNTAYLVADGAQGDGLYRVDLATGKATAVGRIGAGLSIRALAIVP